MAVLVLTLVLSAGVFGRAIAGWMVATVSEKQPMIHVIANNSHEAHECVRHILRLESATAGVQIEIDGHIIVNRWRVAKRPRWYVNILGVLANPYNLLLAENDYKATD
jgi:deferrochelatase/peroxidase EfeB